MLTGYGQKNEDVILKIPNLERKLRRSEEINIEVLKPLFEVAAI